MKKERRCFLCTRREHIIRNYHSRRTCFKCNGCHHTSICHGGEMEKKQKIQDRMDERKEHEKKGDHQKGNVTHSGATICTKNNILMQTAEVEVRPKACKMNRSKARCKIVLDSGSQRSYVLRSILKLIKAPTHHKEDMVVRGFGGSAGKERQHDIVEIVFKLLLWKISAHH